MHTYTRRRDTHKVPEDDENLFICTQSTAPWQIFREKKRGGREQGDWRQLSRTQFAAKPHTALAAHVCLEGEKNKRAPQGGVQQSAAHAHTKLSPPAVPEQALLGAQAVASVAARRRRPWPPFIVPECVTGCWRTRTLCWKASPACSRCCCPAAPAGCTG